MKEKVQRTRYYFVDEAGDPIFYDKRGKVIVGDPGVSKILQVGFIRTEDPMALRLALNNLRNELASDLYLTSIPSMEKTLRYFHAKDDCPEVREKVFKCLKTLDFKAEFIVARKREDIFISRHQKKENIFYDDLVTKLFQNKLHTSAEHHIYFAVRGNKVRQEPLSSAITTAALLFESKWKVHIDSEIYIQAQSMVGEPCLQIADYMNWAVQRAFIKEDDRYLKFMQSKISYLVDLYDFDNYPKNFYNSKNIFDISKISPL